MAIGGTVDLPTIRQRIDVDSAGLSSMKGKLGGLGKTLGMGVAAGAGIAAAGVATFVGKGIAGAVEVERGVREVVTLFGETGAAADAMTAELTAGVADLSNEVGIAQEEITGGLYSAISAGVPKDNAFEFMEVASKAAIAGVTDVETSVDGLSTVINAFGLEADDAAAVSDSMFAAVQGGKTTFEELSASMFNVAPAAAGLGIGFEDVNASIATLTASGTPTSVATTQMRAALAELGKETSVAGQNFEEISGQTFPEFIAQGGTLQEALGMMGEAAGGNATEMSNMFGSVEAGAAASQLGITNAEKFSDELERQAGAAGATGDAFDTMEEGIGRKTERLKTQVSNMAIGVGNALLPMISDVIDKIGPAFQRVADSVGPIIDTIVQAWNVFTGVLTGDPYASEVAGQMGGIMQTAGNLATTFGEIFGTIRNLFGQAVAFVRDNMGQVKEIIAGVLEVVTVLWDLFGDNILRFVREMFAAAMRIIKGALDVIQGVIETVLGILTGDWSRAWEGIKQILGGVWEIIGGIIDAAISRVKFVISVGLDLIRAIFGGVWGKIVDGVSGFVRRVIGFHVDLIAAVRGKISDLVGFVRGLPGRILSALGNLGRLLLDAGKNIVQGLIDGITSKIDAVRDTISDVAGTVRDFLPFSPAKTGPLSGSGAPDRAGRKIGGMLADGIKRSRSDVVNAAASLASAASNPLPSAIGFGTDGTGAAGQGSGGGSGSSVKIDVIARDPGAVAREVDRELGYLALTGGI